jgi:uncharacterized protein (UPF0264 family)
MAELLVSVRSVHEAKAALAGGAAVVDVKEPKMGSLGRCREATISDVIRFVAGRSLVSAALGELLETPAPYSGAGLSFAKWGLAGYGSSLRWRRDLTAAGERLQQTPARCLLVAVAYADWRRSHAPKPEEVCDFACQHSSGALLLDTWGKDGTTLLDWLAIETVFDVCRRCQAAGLGVALAGSLGETEIKRLRPAEPNWFAVRGSVCQGGRRERGIDYRAVRSLVDLLASRSGLQGAKVKGSDA